MAPYGTASHRGPNQHFEQRKQQGSKLQDFCGLRSQILQLIWGNWVQPALLNLLNQPLCLCPQFRWQSRRAQQIACLLAFFPLLDLSAPVPSQLVAVQTQVGRCVATGIGEYPQRSVFVCHVKMCSVGIFLARIHKSKATFQLFARGPMVPLERVA